MVIGPYTLDAFRSPETCMLSIFRLSLQPLHSSTLDFRFLSLQLKGAWHSISRLGIHTWNRGNCCYLLRRNALGCSEARMPCCLASHIMIFQIAIVTAPYRGFCWKAPMRLVCCMYLLTMDTVAMKTVQHSTRAPRSHQRLPSFPSCCPNSVSAPSPSGCPFS